jgi:hypothetical protein
MATCVALPEPDLADLNSASRFGLSPIFAREVEKHHKSGLDIRSSLEPERDQPTRFPALVGNSPEAPQNDHTNRSVWRRNIQNLRSDVLCNAPFAVVSELCYRIDPLANSASANGCPIVLTAHRHSIWRLAELPKGFPIFRHHAPRSACSVPVRGSAVQGFDDFPMAPECARDCRRRREPATRLIATAL